MRRPWYETTRGGFVLIVIWCVGTLVILEVFERPIDYLFGRDAGVLVDPGNDP